MGKHNREAWRYLRNVKSCLPGSRRERRIILNHIQEAMDVFLSENPDACYDEMKSRFGDPQQIAASHIEGKEPEELLKRLRIKKRVLGAVFAVAVLILAMWLGYLAICFQEVEKSADGYLVEGEIAIVERTE